MKTLCVLFASALVLVWVFKAIGSMDGEDARELANGIVLGAAIGSLGVRR